MKNFIIKQLCILCLGVLTASAQAPSTWTHPGSLNSKAELDFVKAKIKAKAQPWTAAFNQLNQLATGYYGTAAPDINGGNGTEDAVRSDAKKAYANALAWYFTDNPANAETAIKILNTWAKTVTVAYKFAGVDQGSQQQLDCGWISSIMGPAAEIMLGYSVANGGGWALTDIAAVRNMFTTKFYPGLNNMSYWNANNDLVQIEGMMDLAIFCEDPQEFNMAVARLALRNPSYFYLESDNLASRTYGGNTFKTSWMNVQIFKDGVEQETCRDNNHHTQFALSSAMHICEAAWHQGLDLFDDATSNNTKRYIATVELMAQQLVTKGMQGICGAGQDLTLNGGENNGPKGDPAGLYDIMEIAYNHYHHRKHIDLPWTKQLLPIVRNNPAQNNSISANDWNILYETLTHADVDSIDVVAQIVKVSPQPLPVPLNGTAQASAVVGPTGASPQVTWTSRDKTIITVDANGIVSGVAIGSTYVVASTPNGKKDSTKCIVSNIAVKGISFNPSTLSIPQGTTSQLLPIFDPINVSNKLADWNSSNKTVAIVSNTGLVTALKEGTTIITAISVDGSFSASVTVTVTPNPRLISVAKTTVAPIIDGAVDESMWILNKTIAKAVVGTQNNTSETFGALWDDTYLYIGVKVMDATITVNNAAAYNNDAVELYFDMNNSGGVYDASDRHWTYVVNGTTIAESGNQILGVKFATKTIVGGYTMEFAIPWTNFTITPSTTPIYGFDIAVDDADGGTRINQNVWMGDANDWSDLSNVGDLQLVGPVVPAITQNIQLVPGWNLISTNVSPADSSIATLFNGLDVQEIKTTDGYWRKGQNPAFNSLQALTAGQAYLINMNIAGKLSVSGTALSTVNYQFATGTGWHYIGCPYQSNTLLSTIFTNTNTATTVKNFDGFWTPNGINSITNLEPGKGYFLKR